MTDPIPWWAWKRTDQLVENPDDLPSDTQGWARKVDRTRTAFARYIAEHEEPPVDPLLVEAREIAARALANTYSGFGETERRRVLHGREDDYAAVQAAHAALKRGIELARTQSGSAGHD